MFTSPFDQLIIAGMAAIDGRTHTISTKLTERDFALIEAGAAAAGETVSSWARRILLAGLQRGQTETLMAEVMATRSLLINLLVPLHRSGHLSDDQIRSLVERVDKEKLDWANDAMGRGKE